MNDSDNRAARYAAERAFWDSRASATVTASGGNYHLPRLPDFAALSGAIHYLRDVQDHFGNLADKTILDLACGDGWISLGLAKSGARVFGCDVSQGLVDLATKYATVNGLGLRATFARMAAEELSFPDNFFDGVIMHAALHHCDIAKTVSQIYRVLKPGGKAALIEDFAYHPLMWLYRRFTPHAHTPTERPLTYDDVQRTVSPFASYALKYFGLLNLFETRQSHLVAPFRHITRVGDRMLLSHFPQLQRFCKLVLILVVK